MESQIEGFIGDEEACHTDMRKQYENRLSGSVEDELRQQQAVCLELASRIKKRSC